MKFPYIFPHNYSYIYFSSHFPYIFPHIWHVRKTDIYNCKGKSVEISLHFPYIYFSSHMASNAMSRIENQDRTCLVQILSSHTFLP